MDFNKLMAQAQAMQNKLEEANSRITASEYEGSASNGMVKIIMTGDNKVKSVSINEELMSLDNKEVLEDMLMIAFNDAIVKVEMAKKDMLTGVTGGMKIPGM